VIVSWNVRDLLARCLDSLFAGLATRIDSRVVVVDIVVVDNASRDGSVEMLQTRFPHVKVVARQDNPGFAGGNNVGMRTLGISPSPSLSFFPSEEGEFVLLLNPDTEVQPGAIRRLLDAIRARPDAAVVTSRLSYGDGSFQHSAFRFPGLAQLYIDLFPVPPRLYETRLNGRYPRRLYDGAQTFEIDHPLGAVMLVRAAAIRQVGLFDESFALYCEEIDWCARFKEAGWRNLCVPAAHVVHHSGQSTSQVRVESFVKLWMARYRLHTKHPQFAPMPLARLIVRSGMRRKMRNTPDEMRAACERIIDVWK
jgi:hypothetical protein